MKESTAFRSIQFSSKSNPSNLFHSSTNYSVNYSRIADLYLNDILSQDSSNSISTRQQNYILPKATTRNLNSGIDKLSTDSILSYNYNIGSNLANTLKPTTSGITGNLLAASNIFKSKSIALGRGFNAEVDSLATNLTSSNYITTASIDKLVNAGTTHRGGLSDDGLLRNPNFSLRSSNQQLLSFEKNVRNINNLSVDTINTNFSDTSHNLLSDLDTKFMGIVRKASTTLALSHIPTSHLGFRGPNITFDKLNPSGLAPDMLMDDKSPLILPFFYQTP